MVGLPNKPGCQNYAESAAYFLVARIGIGQSWF